MFLALKFIFLCDTLHRTISVRPNPFLEKKSISASKRIAWKAILTFKFDILIAMIKAFAGSNFYLIKSYADELRNDFAAKNGDMSVEEIDCEEVELGVLTNALQSTPLFSDKKLIIAKNIARNKKLSGEIEEVFAAAKTGNDLAIIENDIDKRGIYYKFIKKNTEFVECNEPGEDQLVEWLRGEAKNLGADLPRQPARRLINRVGLNQQLLSSELKKLADYDKNITTENIEELTSEKPQSSVFNLLDAAFAGNSKLALKLYDEQKTQGSQPQSILGMIIWQANIIATVAVGANLSPNELSEATGIKPFSITKAEAVYKKLGRKGVSELLDKLVSADKQMKTNSTDPDEVLKNLLVTIS